MPHLSENAKPLKVININKDITNIQPCKSGVELILLPYFESLNEINNREQTIQKLKTFISRIDGTSIIAILTSPVFAAALSAEDEISLNFKLWIAVKLEKPINNEDYVDQQHAALIFFTKQKQSLEHTITRSGYTYCPVCDRTTKDYGGKKHLYHEFGTMMPDVWRDISVDFDKYPIEIVERMKDLFGLEKYNFLKVYDQRNIVKKNPSFSREFKKFNKKVNYTSSNLLINGDCLEILKTIPTNSIDFCFADPPYNVKKKYNSWNDSIDIKEYFQWCDQWLSEMARVLKPGRTLAILNIPKWCIRHFKHLNEILDFQDWIVWEGRSLPSKNIVPIHYSILCFTKGEPRKLPGITRKENTLLEKESMLSLKENYCLRYDCRNHRKKNNYNDKEQASNLWWDIHRIMHNSRRVDHPCQLPPKFMYRLLSLFTNENDLILDPFNGAGTTSLCAELMKRKYIGIELSEYYHKMAEQRHSELKIGIDPFGKKESDILGVKNTRIKRIEKKKYKVSKKVLQLEIKSIANKLGRIPEKEELLSLSKYPIEYFEDYFLDWGEVYAAVRTTGMSEIRERNKKEDNSRSNQLKLL